MSAKAVAVDFDVCIGSGMCTTIAPTVFELDDAGDMRLLQDVVAGDEVDAVADAIACCPVEAIAFAAERP